MLERDERSRPSGRLLCVYEGLLADRAGRDAQRHSADAAVRADARFIELVIRRRINLGWDWRFDDWTLLEPIPHGWRRPCGLRGCGDATCETCNCCAGHSRYRASDR